MCYMNCMYENYHGECRKPSSEPCPYFEPDMRTVDVEYSIYTTLKKRIEYDANKETPDDVIADYVASEEFRENMKSGLTENLLTWDTEVIEVS